MVCQSCQIKLNRLKAQIHARRIEYGVAAIQLSKIRAGCPDSAGADGTCRLAPAQNAWANHSQDDQTIFTAVVGVNPTV